MNYRITTLIGILSIFLSVNFCLASGFKHKKIPGENIQPVLSLEPGPDNPRNSEGSFITLNDGRILFIYSHFTGSSSDDSGSAYLAGRYSEDGGKTWEKKSHLIINQEGDNNVMSVSLLRLKNGDIALFYVKKNSVTDCIPVLRISKDEAKTWGAPVTCIPDRKGYFVLNNDRVVQLENSRLVMPVALHENVKDSAFNLNGIIFSYYSDDNGQTWKSSEKVPNPEKILLQEPGLIELKNGTLMMFMRSDRGVQYISYSGDKGKTWSPVEPGNIRSPCSPASIKRIPSTGDLLMVWNDNGKNQNRTPLNSAISKDEGKTWKRIKSIEGDPDGWYCYTAIHFTGKNILLAYCAGNRSRKNYLSTIHITRLKLNWFYK